MLRCRSHCLVAGALALAISGCSPKGEQRTTTPPRGDGTQAPARTSEVAPRKTPPQTKARPASTPTTTAPYQCPAPGSPGLTPTRWDANKGQLRRYHDETRLDRVVTSKATPVEVCGAQGQIAWLLRARCPGGRAPFKDARSAHGSRSGNVGSGGRCGRIVDLYTIPCGGKTFRVYMDLYNCVRGQKFP